MKNYVIQMENIECTGKLLYNQTPGGKLLHSHTFGGKLLYS